MRIDSLCLRNYRCFDEIRIDFNEHLTVLVAPNGGGKTAILDAIAVAFSPFTWKIGVGAGKKFRVQDSRRLAVSAGSNGAKALSPFQEIILEATGELDGQGISWKRRKPTEEGITTSIEALSLARYANRLLKRLSNSEEAMETVLPIMAYYSTGRLWGPKSFAVSEKGKPLVPRNHGYQGCLSSRSKYESFKAFFGAACFSVLAGRIQQQDRGFSFPEQTLLEESVRNVKNAVQTVLKPYGDCWLDYESAKREIVLTDIGHMTQLGLDQQSDGVQVMVGLAGDIASRTSLLNPQFGENAAKMTPGIVLIDEVDMSLHPLWQQKVLESLRDAFPNIQFIVTTHSPQVLTTVPAECIRVLAQDGDDRWTAEQPREQTKGVESAYVMATVMNTDPIPRVEEAKWVNDYHALIQQHMSDSPEAMSIRSDLERHFGSSHPVMLECDRMIRFAQFKKSLPTAAKREQE